MQIIQRNTLMENISNYNFQCDFNFIINRDIISSSSMHIGIQECAIYVEVLIYLTTTKSNFIDKKRKIIF